uniref:Transmembrane protein 65-like n=1 Tax=Gouania willdenowi TaxID=441366 RepID=A0A8C5GEP6_GOUWI
MLTVRLRAALTAAGLRLPGPRPSLGWSPGCSMGTHGRKEPREPLSSSKRTKEFIYQLQPAERSLLLRELQRFESMAIAQGEVTALTGAQIRYVLLHNALPFVGFGFLDNAIMIGAGTQIELSIGVTLGISTMAGLELEILAGYVEALVTKLGMQVPDLTPKQADQWQTRVSAHMGKALGVSIGCLLGMFPLFFLGDDTDSENQNQS